MGLGKRIATVLPMLLPVLAAGHAIPAYADGATVIDIPVMSQPFLNNCNGDTPFMTGVEHVVMHFVTDGSGGLHFTSLDSEPGLQSDPFPPTASGSSYVVSEINTSTINATVGGSTGPQ